jgi:hypothetical protein
MTDIDIKEFMYSSLKNMNDKISEINEGLKHNTEVTEKVLLQATKTNGRVNSLEERTKDYDSIKAKVNWIMGIGACAVVLGATIYFLALKDISNQIDKKFERCCVPVSTTPITNTVTVK